MIVRDVYAGFYLRHYDVDVQDDLLEHIRTHVINGIEVDAELRDLVERGDPRVKIIVTSEKRLDYDEMKALGQTLK